jgi:hypothetical protein
MYNRYITFNESGKTTFPLREHLIDWYYKKVKLPSKQDNTKKNLKFFKFKYFGGDWYFNILVESIIIQADSRLAAIIILRDYFNEHLRTPACFDTFEDDMFIDIASQYVEWDESADLCLFIFKSEHIDSIMDKYIENEFDNDSLWLIEIENCDLLSATF